VAVVQGTPAASPSLPVLPADTAPTTYYVPLAWVRVPNGFGAGSTVNAQDIRSGVLAHDGSSPVSSFVDLSSGFRVRPATGNNDTSGTYAKHGAFGWSPSSSVRPGPFLPPDFVGGHVVMVEIDASDPSSANWSHQSGDVVDYSIDWRQRMAMVSVMTAQTLHFGNDPTGGSSRLPTPVTNPGPAGGSFAQETQMANTFGQDAIMNAFSVNGAALYYGTHASNASIASGATIALYADMADGSLKFYCGATAPGVRLFAMLLTSGQFPNYT
jgi:hypothetical protein